MLPPVPDQIPSTAAPKLFVSYSWTGPTHAAWVIQLSTELRESGVDVVLDKWDLKEGHDAHVFMEKMVNDPDIKKVILVCDKAYAEKADGRRGGVGTETQIISSEIYEKQAQDKFVAVVVEYDDEGRAYVPTYYRSRIYIDLSNPGSYSENFEQLLRWIYDKPLFVKPDLGQTPAFLTGDASVVTLATSSRFKRAVEAIRGNRDHAVPATIEYLTSLAEQLEKFRIDPTIDPFDEAVVESIDAFLPYRNEAIDLFLSLALYLDTTETRNALHRFFEQLIPYLDQPANVSQFREWDFDNFRFIVHELFLYATACFTQHERFESAAYLMGTEYFVPKRQEYGNEPMVPFEIIRQYTKSLEFRNERLNLKRLSLRADLLKDRCKGVGIEFQQLMQADFILFLRDRLDNPNARWHWWPETLVYAEHQPGAFEVFARSRSAKYFARAKLLLGIDSKDSLQPVFESFASDPQSFPRWQHRSFQPTELLGFNEIGAKP